MTVYRNADRTRLGSETLSNGLGVQKEDEDRGKDRTDVMDGGSLQSLAAINPLAASHLLSAHRTHGSQQQHSVDKMDDRI
jgi:hypothetical protein